MFLWSYQHQTIDRRTIQLTSDVCAYKAGQGRGQSGEKQGLGERCKEVFDNSALFRWPGRFTLAVGITSFCDLCVMGLQ